MTFCYIIKSTIDQWLFIFTSDSVSQIQQWKCLHTKASVWSKTSLNTGGMGGTGDIFSYVPDTN